MSEQALLDKIALVTGASRGIGQAIAKHLAQCGATVIGTATTQAGVDRITNEITTNNSRGEILELTKKDSIEALINKMKDTIGLPDILVNNAGITRDNLFIRMKDEEWNDVIETNLTATYQLTKLCVKAMIKKRWGRIINISSVVGSTGNPGQANYVAAKAAMNGLTKTLAIELASRGITVNAVSPGFIATDMTSKLPEVHQEKLLAQIPQGKMGKPEHIASMVTYLAKTEAEYITGQVLHVNGGMYLS